MLVSAPRTRSGDASEDRQSGLTHGDVHGLGRYAYRTPANLDATIGARGPHLRVADLSSQGASVTTGRGVGLPEIDGPVPLVIDFGVFGEQRYQFTPTGVFGNRIGGRLRAQTDTAQRTLDAAVFVIAPRARQLDQTSLWSETAQTLATRLTYSQPRATTDAQPIRLAA